MTHGPETRGTDRPERLTELLLDDHAELQRLFAELRNAVEGADDATISSVWTEFERRLESHMDAEERFLLPRLERSHAVEVRRIRQEHALLRALVAELGIRADLRTLRKEVADALVAALEQHARFEEQSVYAWADRELAPSARSGLLNALFRRGGAVL